MVLDAEQPPSRPTRRIVEWSPDVELLSSIHDRLGELITVTLAAAGSKKPPKPEPAPRPRTALDRVRERRRSTQHRSLVSRMLPHKAEQATE